MKSQQVITPYTHEGFVVKQTNLGVQSYDSEELWSPDTAIWKSKVLDLGSPKFTPNKTYWFDRSRYCNHGTITGGVWKQLPSGVWAMTFDGDDLISCGTHSSLLSFSNGVTVIGWIKLDALGNHRGVVSNGPNAASWANHSYTLKINNTNVVESVLNDSTGAATCTGLTALTAGRYYCVGMTYNFVNNIVYLDGRPDNSTAYTTAITASVSATRIGKYRDGFFMLGKIGQLMVLSGVLSAESHYQFYRATKWRYQ